MNRASLNCMLRTIKSYLYIPITVLSAFFVFKVLLLPGIVPTASMEPTIRAGSFYMASRVTYAIQGPQRGKIVLFRDRAEGNKIGYVKRIIGMPGDNIRISPGIPIIRLTYPILLECLVTIFAFLKARST